MGSLKLQIQLFNETISLLDRKYVPNLYSYNLCFVLFRMLSRDPRVTDKVNQ